MASEFRRLGAGLGSSLLAARVFAALVRSSYFKPGAIPAKPSYTNICARPVMVWAIELGAVLGGPWQAGPGQAGPGAFLLRPRFVEILAIPDHLCVTT